MNMNLSTIALIVVVSLLGGLALVIVTKFKPQWKQPIKWAVAGIIVFKLFEYLLEFILA